MVKTIHIENKHIDTGLEHTSKGNQMKWHSEGIWYKVDAFGYESLAETVVSTLLKHSTLSGFVEYEPVMIQYEGVTYRGCASANFRKAKQELIPLERLVRNYTGTGLAKQLARIRDVRERILYTEELVRTVTGLTDFGAYLTKLLEMDAFFLNEDRHTNNISLLYDVESAQYSYCPFYDMGLSLFSDTRDAYPISKGFLECREIIKAKPFDRDFDEQLDAANELYGSFLQFRFPASRIIDMMHTQADLGEFYQGEELRRVEETLRYQAAKYRYMFRE